MKILHLTLYREWFEQIRDGAKVEECRQRKPYWIKRLVGRHYDEVHFKNGYAKNAPFMRVECLGIVDGEPIVIKLGKVLEVK